MTKVAMLMSLGLSAIAAAQTLDETIVYIECTPGGGGAASRGSGVMVSPDGLVLTAKHVIPEMPGTVCMGVIGNAFWPKTQLIVRRKSSSRDAATLKFGGVSDKPFVKYCKLDDQLRREMVFATGFPGQTGTGVPSSRLGVLSTVELGSDGLIETDSATTRGMSGGMVTLGNGPSLIGIIAGAQFDPGTGQPAFYGVLPAQEIAVELELIEESQPCSRLARLPKEVTWHVGEGSHPLGMSEDEGYCFLTSVWGVHDHADDAVRVEVDQNGQYMLVGGGGGGGQHGASARCVPF